MKKTIIIFALVCVLLTPVVPQANAQELSPEREAEMRAEISRLSAIVDDLVKLFVRKFGKYPDGRSADPLPVLEKFLNQYGGVSSYKNEEEEENESEDTSQTTSPSSILEKFLNPYGGVSSYKNEEEEEVTADEEEESVLLEHELVRVLDYAGALYLEKGTYGTVCNKSEVVALRREYDATCIDSESTYFMYIELDEGYFCVDANGFSGEVDDVDEGSMACE